MENKKIDAIKGIFKKTKAPLDNILLSCVSIALGIGIGNIYYYRINEVCIGIIIVLLMLAYFFRGHTRLKNINKDIKEMNKEIEELM